MTGAPSPLWLFACWALETFLVGGTDTGDIYWYSRYSRYRTHLLIQQIQQTSENYRYSRRYKRTLLVQPIQQIQDTFIDTAETADIKHL